MGKVNKCGGAKNKTDRSTLKESCAVGLHRSYEYMHNWQSFDIKRRWNTEKVVMRHMADG